MEYLIRKCERGDLPRVVELCRNHAEYEQESYNAEGKLALLDKALFDDNPQLHCYLVEADALIKGYFTYTYDFSTWDAQKFIYLDCLYLEPEIRSLGIGEKIIKMLKQIAMSNHCLNMQWQTPNFNTRAVNFYKRVGGLGKEKVRFVMNIE